MKCCHTKIPNWNCKFFLSLFFLFNFYSLIASKPWFTIKWNLHYFIFEWQHPVSHKFMVPQGLGLAACFLTLSGGVCHFDTWIIILICYCIHIHGIAFLSSLCWFIMFLIFSLCLCRHWFAVAGSWQIAAWLSMSFSLLQSAASCIFLSSVWFFLCTCELC